MARIKGEGRITTSVTISPHFYDLAKRYNISFTEALRVGLSLMFAEMGENDYDNNLNLYRKMKLFQQQLEQKGMELEELKRKLNQNETNNS